MKHFKTSISNLKICFGIIFLLVFTQNTIALNLSYIKDNQYDIEKIVKNKNWNSFDATNKSLGLDTSNYWFKLSLNKANIERFLSLENSHLDYIDYYLVDKNGKLIKEIKTGDLRKFNSREIHNNFFTFRVPAEECTIYLKIKTQGVLILTAKLFSSTTFLKTNITRWGFYWLTIGIALCSFIFNLLFWLKIKDTIFLKYILLTIALIIFLLSNYSFHFQYFYPNHPEINKYNILFFVFSILYLPYFCLSIFKNSKYEKLIIKFEYSLILIGIFLVILYQIMGYNVTIKISLITSIIIIIIASISSIIFCFNQTTLEKIYITIGVNFYLIFFMIYALVMPGTIKNNVIIENSLEIGTAFMLMFGFLSVVNKFDILKTEAYDSKNRIIELLEKQAYEIKHRNNILEEKVKERTNILEERNAEIETQNEQLYQQWQYVENQRLQLEEQNLIITEKQKIIDDYNANLEKIVSERTEDLQKTNHLLEATNLQLSHYTFITAHNLRAPVASMVGLLQLLKKINKPFDINDETFKRVDNSANKLNAVVRDLSTFLQSPSVLKKHFEIINLNVLIADLLELIEVDIKDSKAAINWIFKGKEEIYSVKVFIQSIFFNIILNSIKYRKANESPVVKIEIDAISDEDFCKITFTDNGLGVEIENLEDFQLKSQNSTNAGGLGLGLTIIKKQITALQGKMLIDGKNNIGTTFTVWIPKQEVKLIRNE